MLLVQVTNSNGYGDIADGAAQKTCPNGQYPDPTTGNCVSYPVIPIPISESMQWISNIVSLVSLAKFFI